MTTPIKQKCNLCDSFIYENKIVEDSSIFCCHGCLAVFRILSAKKELENVYQHPLFTQAVKSGLISNPEILSLIQSKQIDVKADEKEKLYLEILEMWCPSCSEVIYLVLMQEKGIVNCVVDYATDLASIEYLPRFISKEKIYRLIKNLGYLPNSIENKDLEAKTSTLYLKFIVAAFCSLNIMMFSYPLYASYFDYDPLEYGKFFAYLSLLLSLPVMTYSFIPILKRFYYAAKLGIYGMETLIVIGVLSSFFLSLYELFHGSTKVYFDSMAVIVTFVLLGKMMESKAKFSAKGLWLKLKFCLPRRARKYFSEEENHFVPIKEIHEKDLILVLQGEKIPLDGVVVKGFGLCDESLMTGESIPIIKNEYSKVTAGTFLQNGQLVIEVLKKAESSFLTQVIHMIENAALTKSQYKRKVDSIILYVIPFVFFMAFCAAFYSFLLGEFQKAFINAISVILISCPCAIGIAVPLAESYLMQRLTSFGVLVQNRAVLNVLGKETAFVFDKTGTMTEGKFIIRKGLETLTDEELSVLKALSEKSQHLICLSLAKSICQKPVTLNCFEEITSKGLKALFMENVYHLGSLAFLKQEGVIIKENIEIEPEMLSKVYFSINHELKTVIYLGDELKPEAKKIIASLKTFGKTVLLSGDTKEVVEKVGAACSFDEIYFQKNPLEKKEIITALKNEGYVVSMIGDGINDAAAITEADVGISFAKASDVSIHVSDILLTENNLLSLLNLRSSSIFGATILKQNLFWAFFYNVIGIFLAAFGLLSPIFATFAMMMSSLIVLYNAKRI